ncbi:SIR2 family protein [Myxococcus faecalis]|uniref:SIR2 family protein n=1 Tax=Myxococcus TaxID=32 RepID=UPI001CBB4743|nr:SIR2 family protein [Myxococcus sp. XM-1-1-1]MBZ4409145.1 SIR2 family protein [Myxococcus sp. XM-1-1-1]BDT35090.1 SIR2 family protein [Myxococcus sp. MH1]
MPVEALERLASPNSLLNSLSNSDKKIAFLVGSPLSMPDTPGSPGVPGTAEMVRRARAAAGAKAEAEFDATLATADSTRQYQLAMQLLRSWSNQEAVNRVIREAVLQARLTASSAETADVQRFDEDHHGWYLPAATRDLGKLVVSFPERFGPILTTNFDPLISVAIRQAGGRVSQVILHADGRLDAVRPERGDHRVVHLHGYWTRSDTLHTPIQLTQERPNLDASLQSLLREYILVVVGYGGWDDIVTQALAKCGHDTHANVDIVWAFYESDSALVHFRYKSLISSIGSISGRGRFRMYGGINCHTMFKDLHREIERLATPTSIAPPPSVPKEVLVPVAAPPRPSPADVVKAVPPAPPATTAGRVDPPVAPTASLPPTKVEPSRTRFGPRLLVPLLLVAVGFLYLRESESTPHRPEPTTPSPERGRSQRQRESRGSNPDLPIVPVAQQPAPPRAVPISGLVGASTHPSTIEGLRSKNQVSLIPRSNRPQRANDMPEGSYGFAPTETVYQLRAATVVATPTGESFEFHRLRNDTFTLVGYVQPASRTAFDQGRAMNLVLAPRPDSERQQLLGVPFQRISSLGLRSDGGSRVLLVSLSEAPR